jgi:hypothetical protein
MMLIQLVHQFIAGNLNLISINYYNEIPRIHVRGKNGFMFAPNVRRDPAGQPAQHLILRIDNIPFALNLISSGKSGSHRDTFLLKKLSAISIQLSAG